MKETYIKPELEMVRLVADIILESGEDDCPEEFVPCPEDHS